MNREEFELVSVNIMAICNCIFTKNSNALIGKMSEKLQESNEFDNNTEASIFTEAIDSLCELGIDVDDPSRLIKDGYASLVELKPQFDSVYSKLNPEKLSQLLVDLPEINVDLIEGSGSLET